MSSTNDIIEAAIFYIHNMELVSYTERSWVFKDNAEVNVSDLRKKLVNKKLLVEPLIFSEAIRNMKGFSRGNDVT